MATRKRSAKTGKLVKKTTKNDNTIVEEHINYFVIQKHPKTVSDYEVAINLLRVTERTLVAELKKRFKKTY